MMLAGVRLIPAEHDDFRVRAKVAKATDHAAQDCLISDIETAVRTKYADTEIRVTITRTQLRAR